VILHRRFRINVFDVWAASRPSTRGSARPASNRFYARFVKSVTNVPQSLSFSRHNKE
jgi:hypothetical protein